MVSKPLFFSFTLFFLLLISSLLTPNNTFAQCAANNCNDCTPTNSLCPNSPFCVFQSVPGIPNGGICIGLNGCSTSICQNCQFNGNCLSPCSWTSIPGIPNGGICSPPSSPPSTPTNTPTPTPMPSCNPCGTCSGNLQACSNNPACEWSYQYSSQGSCAEKPVCGKDHCELCATDTTCNDVAGDYCSWTNSGNNCATPTCKPTPPSASSNWLLDIWNWLVTNWNNFWSWFVGTFIKKYTIPTDPTLQQGNFTDYGIADNDNENTQNINAAENRETNLYQQYYFKGRYMMDVLSGTILDMPIVKVCNGNFVNIETTTTDTCYNFGIVCLAKCFINDSQPFVYADQNGTVIPISQYSAKVDSMFNADCACQDALKNLSSSNFPRYKDIYLNFFRVPPDYSIAVKNENATRVLRTPVPNVVQTPIPQNVDDATMKADIENQKAQLNKNFIPQGTGWSGLGSLRPAGW